MDVTTSSPFQNLLRDAWETQLQLDPLYATMCGERRFNDRLPQVGEEAAERQRQALRGFIARLEGIERAGLTPAEQVDYDVFGHMLRGELSALEVPLYRMDFSKHGAFHTLMLDVIQLTPFESESDYQAYLKRLDAFLEYAHQNIALLRYGLQTGYRPAKPALEGALETVTAHIVSDPQESLFFQPLRTFPAGIPEDRRAALQDAARQAIQSSVLPASRRPSS